MMRLDRSKLQSRRLLPAQTEVSRYSKFVFLTGRSHRTRMYVLRCILHALSEARAEDDRREWQIRLDRCLNCTLLSCR